MKFNKFEWSIIIITIVIVISVFSVIAIEKKNITREQICRNKGLGYFNTGRSWLNEKGETYCVSSNKIYWVHNNKLEEVK